MRGDPMPRRPRLADLFGTSGDRGLVTHDGTMIVQGESYPIRCGAIALDEGAVLYPQTISFDGAVPLDD